MRKTIPLLVCVSLLTILTNAQDYWSPVNMPPAASDAYLIEASASGLLVMGSYDQIYFSTDEGESWTVSSNWPGYQPNAMAFNSVNTLFVGSYLNGIYRSYNNGLTFEPINTGLTALIIHSLLVLENDDLLVGTPVGIFRSQNEGNSWEPFGTGLPSDAIKVLTVTSTGVLLCGTINNGVYRSSDGGASWTASGSGLPSGSEITAMESAPEGMVFAGLWPDGMYRSTDNGLTWEAFNEGLPFTKLATDGRGYSIDRITYMNYFIYCIIYFMGAYMMDLLFDAPDVWTQVNSGLPGEPTTTDLSGAPGNMLYLCASGQGLYRNTFPVALADIGIDHALSVFPNPASGVSRLRVNAMYSGVADISVYNALGIRVMQVWNGELPLGESELTINCSSLSPGIYLVRYKDGTREQTTRLLIENR